MYRIIIQHAALKQAAPKISLLRQWAKKTLDGHVSSAEITIRIVDVEEMTALNTAYRHKQGPTNVLSFPFDIPTDRNTPVPILGDIIICADVVNEEAKVQHKTQEGHWAHMIVHGILHLLGHDHETDTEAAIMESLEIKTLQSLGFSNPYENSDETIHHD